MNDERFVIGHAEKENDDEIVGTILSRREALTFAARAGFLALLGGAVLPDALASADAAFQAEAQSTVRLVAAPALTEGPFYVDEHLIRSDLVAGTTRESVAKGIPLDLQITLYRMGADGKFSALKGATFDLWQADAIGVYSDESAPMNHENTAGQNWLRGAQISDANGRLRFRTIIPGWYPGRTTHLHFKVREATSLKAQTKEFTSQLFFDDAFSDAIFAKAPYRARGAQETRNANDMVFTERQVDGSQAGQHLLLEPRASGGGYAAEFAIALTDESFASRRGGFGRPPF